MEISIPKASSQLIELFLPSTLFRRSLQHSGASGKDSVFTSHWHNLRGTVCSADSCGQETTSGCSCSKTQTAGSDYPAASTMKACSNPSAGLKMKSKVAFHSCFEAMPTPVFIQTKKMQCLPSPHMAAQQGRVRFFDLGCWHRFARNPHHIHAHLCCSSAIPLRFKKWLRALCEYKEQEREELHRL